MESSFCACTMLGKGQGWRQLSTGIVQMKLGGSSGKQMTALRLIKTSWGGCPYQSHQMPSRILRNERERADWVRFLDAQPFPMTVSHLKGENRTQQQNRTLHMWFGQVSQETGSEAWEVKGYCKAKFGLPIMKRDNPEWVAEYEPLYMPLTYQFRIKFFSFVPMTSIMKVQQMTEIMDAVQRHYTQQGMALRDPEALKYEAHSD